MIESEKQTDSKEKDFKNLDEFSKEGVSIILHGDKDCLVSVKDSIAFVNDCNMPSNRLVILENGDHFLQKPLCDGELFDY
eukprot:CAMPEP_0116900714 /NCGR_PEP_ID=MMETSP0467-20121206/8881_1 /TAXON_ID=283647 /ORGANISM="Mesodinium pulex, Strain SPMC105" /LENGTH=79 /DNA_ID=CAMNT_0004574007 /DNA_START=429 /DNA_END=668 /DNA_ORIENTATION=+